MDATFGDCWGCKSPSKGIKCENCNVAEYCSIECRMRYCHIHKVQCSFCIALSSCSVCKEKSANLKKCSRCFGALYCNSDCQKRHWSDHKWQCNGFFESAKLMTAIIHRSPPFYQDLPAYVGSTFAEDHLNILKNEGASYDFPMKLLFIGVGDLKNVVKTVVDVPRQFSKSIEYVLNDFSPHIMARNILFLYCLLVKKNANHLIQIWYSIKLTSKCFEFLKSVLTSLINLSKEQMLTEFSLLEINDSDLNICKEVWKGWIRLSNNQMTMQKVAEFRDKVFKTTYAVNGLRNYCSTVPEIHVKSLKAFLDSGILAVDDNHRANAVHINPTLTCFNPMIEEYEEMFPDIHASILHMNKWDKFVTKENEMIYSVRNDDFVFNSWDYLEIKKRKGMKPDINHMYIGYLESIYTRFRDSVQQRNVRFRVIISDFQEIDKELSPEEKFDRIAVSNLCDYFPTPYVLEKLSPYLNFDNKYSVVICRYEKWHENTGFWDSLPCSEILETVNSLIFSDIMEREEVLNGLQSSSKIFVASGFQMCREDYADSYSYVFKFLLVDSLLYQLKKENLNISNLSAEHPAVEACKFGLNFRDFRIELNRVVPFFREGNIRKISVMRNTHRFIEWHHFE